MRDEADLLTRAVVISLTGAHSVLVISNPTLDISPLREVLATTAARLSIPPKPIGNVRKVGRFLGNELLR